MNDNLTDRYHTGYYSLGPIFRAFGQALIQAAVDDRIQRLLFVSRDGWFLKEVVEKIQHHFDKQAMPELDYICLSRISTALPRLTRINEHMIDEVWAIKPSPQSISDFLTYYGLDANDFEDSLKRLGLDLDAPLHHRQDLVRLIHDNDFQKCVVNQREMQRSLLAAYLKQHGMLGNGKSSALVDIGWRGTIAASLVQTYPEYFWDTPLRIYQLGYWQESKPESTPGVKITGLLSDVRRSRNVIEGSSYYLAHVLEAICRAEHGTVTGYRRDWTENILPVFAEDTTSREAEILSSAWAKPIRTGISDYLEAIDAELGPMQRLKTQRRMFRLAFFPSEVELESFQLLTHSEGHLRQWSFPMIAPSSHSPWRSFRYWLAGLSSPWRSGYVMSTGGKPFTVLFIALESLLLILPHTCRNTLKTWGRGWARRQ